MTITSSLRFPYILDGSDLLCGVIHCSNLVLLKNDLFFCQIKAGQNITSYIKYPLPDILLKKLTNLPC